MTDSDLAQRIAELERKHELLEGTIIQWYRDESKRLLNIELAIERLEARVKDLDTVEKVAFRAYEATHPNVYTDLRQLNRVVDEAATRIYRRHEATLQKPDKGKAS